MAGLSFGYTVTKTVNNGQFNSETAKLAGQKSKRGISLRVKLLNSLFDEKTTKLIFKKLEIKAKGGDMEAIKTYLAYCFGKPEAKLDITSDGDALYDVSKLSTEQLKNLWEIKSSIEN